MPPYAINEISDRVPARAVLSHQSYSLAERLQSAL